MPHRTSPLASLRAATALGALLLCPLLATSSSAQTPARAKVGPVFENGQAQIVPAFADTMKWIRQELWVETDFDSDKDGKKDRVHVDVTRPGPTGEGLKVPVILASSPYFSGTGSSSIGYWDVKSELGAGFTSRVPMPVIRFEPVRPRISTSEIRTWVPRGFAVMHQEQPGTGLSDGCPTIGGHPEIYAPKAVIDWLNGRAKGFTSRTGKTEVKADWTTGKVGMTGTSYEGTLPLAAATTGVKGLEAIIPISPNTSYYHYYRSNGLVRSPGGYLGEDISVLYDFVHSGDPAVRPRCDSLIRDGLFAKNDDRVTGDYSAFWADRDLLPRVKNVKAAVLLAHGTNDYNVVPEHTTRIYEALKAQHKPAMIYLHQGGHGGPPPLDVMNKWWSHYLYGIDNGIDKAPRALIVREGGGRGAAPTAYADYPVPGSAPVALHPSANGSTVGMLAVDAPTHQGTQKLVDDVQFTAAVLATSDKSPNRLLFATPVLKDSVHISGTTTVTVKLAASKAAANLTAILVTLPFDNGRAGSSGMNGIVTRGWADPQNSKQLTHGGNYDSKEHGKPLEPGKFVTLTFDLQPTDKIVPAGKRLALMILSSDREFTLWPQAGTELTIDLDATSVAVPVVGGAVRDEEGHRQLKYPGIGLLALVIACGGGRDALSSAHPTIDTLPGGVIRVVNHGPSEWADSNGWRLVLERTIHTAESGPGIFTSPRNVVATSRGEIVILDRKPAAISMFSATGEFLRTIGRQGAGPGEYADYGDLRIVGDTLIVNDRGNARMVLFTLDGKHLRTFPGVRGPARGAATSDGRLGVMEYLAHPPTTLEDNYAGQGVRRYRTDGSVSDSLFYPPEPRPKVWALKDATHDLGAMIPFSPERVTTFDHDGRLIWGDQGQYRLVVSGTGRDTIRVIESSAPEFPIGDSLRQAELADVIKGSDWAVNIAKLADIPTTFPLWTDVTVDGVGNIWVLRPGPGGPGSTFDVFTAEGRFRGSLPAPFATLDYSFWTADRVYRIGESAEGQPTVEVWKIVPKR